MKEALALLAGEDAKVLAGGMSLIPLMKLRLAAPEQLVDIGRVPDLNYIREDKGVLRIGATTTHYEIESSPAGALPLSRCWPKPLRTSATCRCATAAPSAAASRMPIRRPTIPLPCWRWKRQVVLASREEHSATLPLADFFVDTFTTALEPGEIIKEVIVPVEDQSAGTSYQKMVQPASGFAIVGVAARVRKSGGKVAMARVGVTGLAGKPYRATNVEKALEGHRGQSRPTFRKPPRWWPTASTPTPTCTPPPTIANIWPQSIRCEPLARCPSRAS